MSLVVFTRSPFVYKVYVVTNTYVYTYVQPIMCESIYVNRLFDVEATTSKEICGDGASATYT